MTGFSKQVRDRILDRAQGQCEICWFAPAAQVHHRRARGMGSTRRPESNMPANGLALCLVCHLMVESNRELALENGWLVRQEHDPAGVAVMRHGSDWYLLDNQGGTTTHKEGA